MCLIINTKYHHLRNGMPLAKIAKDDIPCYKLLIGGSHGWVTPFQCYNIKFKNGQCVQQSRIHPCMYTNGDFFITRGIHGFISKGIYYLVGYRFNAIIPKGTRYYIGMHNDMVSEKLIIYEDNYEKVNYTRK